MASTILARLTDQELKYIVKSQRVYGTSEYVAAFAKQELEDRADLASSVGQIVAKLKSLGYVVLSPAERESDGCPFCGQVMV